MTHIRSDCSTLDQVAMDALMSKPMPLSANERTSTIDALNIDLNDDDPALKPVEKLSRPPALRTEGRLSTAEYIDIVNEPIGGDEDQYNGVQS